MTIRLAHHSLVKIFKASDDLKILFMIFGVNAYLFLPMALNFIIISFDVYLFLIVFVSSQLNLNKMTKENYFFKVLGLFKQLHP